MTLPALLRGERATEGSGARVRAGTSRDAKHWPLHLAVACEDRSELTYTVPDPSAVPQ
jgi:hypothetical protein